MTSKARTFMAAATPRVWNRWRSHNRHRDNDPGLNRDSTYDVVYPRPWSGASFESTTYSGGASRRNSHLNIVPEERASEDQVENDDDIEWLLEERGLYKGQYTLNYNSLVVISISLSGSYTRVVAFYTFVPLSCLILLVLIALVPPKIWPLSSNFPPSSGYPKSFPFPLPELISSMSLWSLSHIIRVPIYNLTRSLFPHNYNVSTTFVSTSIQVTLTNFLRLTSIPLLQIPHTMDYYNPTWKDPSFRRVTWLALGWSIAEVVVGITQGYAQIRLYKDVMVPEGREEEFLNGSGLVKDGNMSASTSSGIRGGSGTPPHRNVLDEETTQSPVRLSRVEGDDEEGGEELDEAEMRARIDRDIDRLLAFKAREELQEVYGMPAIVCISFQPMGLVTNLIYLSTENTRLRIVSPTPKLNHPLPLPHPPPLRILPPLPPLPLPLPLLSQISKRIHNHIPHYPPHPHLPLYTPHPTCASPDWVTCSFVCELFGRDCLFVCGVGGLGRAFLGKPYWVGSVVLLIAWEWMSTHMTPFILLSLYLTQLTKIHNLIHICVLCKLIFEPSSVP